MSDVLPLDQILDKSQASLEPVKEPEATVQDPVEQVKEVVGIKEIVEELQKRKEEGDIATQILVLQEKIKGYNLTQEKETALLDAWNKIVDEVGVRGDVNKCRTILDNLLDNVVTRFTNDDRLMLENNKKQNLGYISYEYGNDGFKYKEAFVEQMRNEFGLTENEVMSMSPAGFQERFRAFKTRAVAPQRQQTININMEYSPDASTFSKKIELPRKL